MKTKGADLIFSLFSGAECQQDLRGREIVFENVAVRVNTCDVIKNMLANMTHKHIPAHIRSNDGQRPCL